MRRVLTVIPAPTFGGSSVQVVRLYEPLREAGWELVAAVPTEPGNVADRLREAGVEVHQTPMHRLRASTKPGPHLALARHTGSEIAALRRLVRATGASVVQNHGDLNPQGGIAGHLEGAAVHWEILDTRTPDAIRRVTMQLVTRLADSISSVGHELAATHPGALDFGDRCVVLYMPVEAAPFAAAHERRAAARAELEIADDEVCIGAIGNRNPQKGFEWLVRAAAIVRERRPEAVVRILGAPSPGHEAYERALREEAAALGLTGNAFVVRDPGRRVAELIGAFDLLCLPSVPRSEGMPTVILEAMAAGLPVVATDVGAVSEEVFDGETGRVVGALDPAALAAAVEELVADAALRRSMGEAGQRVFAQRFSLERLVGLWSEAYGKAVDHRSGRRRNAAVLRGDEAG